MFVRATKTRSSTSRTGEAYFTHRLVRTERVAVRHTVDGVTRTIHKVRQITLVNLGREFELASKDWPAFCTRLEHLLAGQPDLVPEHIAPDVETCARRYAALLKPRTAVLPVTAPDTALPTEVSLPAATTDSDHAPIWVDARSQEAVDSRSVGVEALALHAIHELQIDQSLRTAGFNSVDLAAAIGQIVARMAQPASERQTHAWLQQHSALGELHGFDYGRLSLTRLYQVGDKLIGAQQTIEKALYQRISEEFGLEDKIALYDLTNTYFEGMSSGNPKAQRGFSKEKRSDCPLLTLGLVLDSQGFVRRSQVFAGNIGEAGTLQEMLGGLKAPAGAMVIVDRGLVSKANLSWLKTNGYRYLVMTRERMEMNKAGTLHTAQRQPLHWERLVHEDGDVRLICHSTQRAVKETAMHKKSRDRFDRGIEHLRAGLLKPRGTKHPDRLQRRIGRLLERHAGLAQHYTIQVVSENGKIATAIESSYHAIPRSRAELPGHYTLRSNDLTMTGEQMWRIYIQLTEVESAFRSLKSELGLRPIHHQLEKRCQAHLWISVLAYQCVQFLRRKLAAAGIEQSWTSLRNQLREHKRVTITQTLQAGGMLHTRQTVQPTQANKATYDALKLTNKPGGVHRRIFRAHENL